MGRTSRSSVLVRIARPVSMSLVFAAALVVALVVALATSLIFLALSSPAFADDSGVSVSVGGGVHPMTSTDIRMESETVQATCYRNFAEYRVDFKFVNDGQPQTLQLGFSSADIMPAQGVGEPSTIPPQQGAPVALRAWQDGKPLRITVGKGMDPMLSSAWVGYYLHTATFPHGETTITVRYLASLTSDGSPRFEALAPPEFAALGVAGWGAAYRYWLHTGAYWNGPIGKAIVRYRLADSFDGWGVDVGAAQAGGFEDPGPTTGPESYVRPDGRTYQWVFDNLEPTPDDDIVLAFTTLRPSLSYDWDSEMPLPASLGAVAVPDGASERLGPNGESMMPPGWEAIDGMPDTAWGFSAKAYDKWLRIGVRGNHDLREIRILPGRNDTPTSFTEYARPKTLTIDLSDGTSREFTLEDEPSLQRLAISGTAMWALVGIKDVYPGTKSNDIYISEIDLGNARAPEFDTFSNMMAGGAPPTTEPLASVRTSTTSIASTTSSASASSASTSLASGATSTSGATGGPASPGGGEESDSTRLLWPAIVGGVVAAIALGVLIYLAGRLRRRGKASGS
jgi:hypothetical protein